MAPYPPRPSTLPTTPAQPLVPPYPWLNKTVAIACLAVAPLVILLVWLFLSHQRRARAVAPAQPCHHERDVDIRSRSPFKHTQDTIYISMHPRAEPPRTPTLTSANPPSEPTNNVSPLALPRTTRHTRMQSISTESCTSQTSMVTLYRQSNVNVTPAALEDPFADSAAIDSEEDDYDTVDDDYTEENDAPNPPPPTHLPYPRSDSGISGMRPDSGFAISVRNSELYQGSTTTSVVSLSSSLVALIHVNILAEEHMRTVDEGDAVETWLASYEEWSEEWSGEWSEETSEDGEAAERSTSEDGGEGGEDEAAGAGEEVDLYGAD